MTYGAAPIVGCPRLTGDYSEATQAAGPSEEPTQRPMASRPPVPFRALRPARDSEARLTRPYRGLLGGYTSGGALRGT